MNKYKGVEMSEAVDNLSKEEELLNLNNEARKAYDSATRKGTLGGVIMLSSIALGPVVFAAGALLTGVGAYQGIFGSANEKQEAYLSLRKEIEADVAARDMADGLVVVKEVLTAAEGEGPDAAEGEGLDGPDAAEGEGLDGPDGKS